MTTHIRRCRKDDATALSLVGKATFLDAFAGVLDGPSIVAYCATAHGVETYREWLSHSTAAAWLVECEPGLAPVGYAVVAPPDLPLDNVNDDDLELKRIYLLQRFRGMGIGRQLVETTVAYARSQSARRLLLGVYSRNEPAIGFYKQVGFEIVGTRQFNVGGQWNDDYILAMPI